ncbi:hypothetical protein MMC30_006010 [Trapelia coarctata]|nr:hypothetical protein [Trapelia coarctata]
MKLQLLLTAVIGLLPFQVTADQTFTVPEVAQWTIPATINGAQYTAINIDVNSFISAQQTAAARSSVYSALGASHVQISTVDTSSKSWYTAFPTVFWPYFSDYQATVQSVIDQDVAEGKAVTPTVTASALPKALGVGLEVKFTAAVIAAGVVALAVL